MKRLVVYVLLAGALVALVYIVGDRLIFLSKASSVAGEVIQVTARNDTCSSGGNRSSYPCTKYSATIHYITVEDGSSYRLRVSAGDAAVMAYQNPSRNIRLESWSPSSTTLKTRWSNFVTAFGFCGVMRYSRCPLWRSPLSPCWSTAAPARNR